MREWMKLFEDNGPADQDVDDRTYHGLRARNAHKVVSKPLGYADGYEVEFHPHGGEQYAARQGTDKVAYYDPSLADLHTDDGEYAYTHARPKEGYHTTIEPLEGNVIYRGMSYEELQHINETGQVASKGDYNMTGQEGLTYWTTDVNAAISYANHFAPNTHRPTFTHPCYVIAAAMPKETRHVDGVADHEVGVARPIKEDEIIAVWEGKVYDHKPHSMELRADDAYGNPTKRYRSGSSSAASSSVVWKRLV